MHLLKPFYNLKRKFSKTPELPTGNLQALATPRPEFKAELKELMLQTALPKEHKQRNHTNHVILPFAGGILVGLATLVVVINGGLIPFLGNSIGGNNSAGNILVNKKEILTQVYANNPGALVAPLAGDLSGGLVPKFIEKPSSSASSSSTTSTPADQIAVTVATTTTTPGPVAARCAEVNINNQKIVTYSATYQDKTWQRIEIYNAQNQLVGIDLLQGEIATSYRNGSYAVQYTRIEPDFSTNDGAAVEAEEDNTNEESFSSTSTAVSSFTSLQFARDIEKLSSAEVSVTEQDGESKYLITNRRQATCNAALGMLITESIAEPDSFKIDHQITYFNRTNPESVIYSVATESEQQTLTQAKIAELSRLPANTPVKQVRNVDPFDFINAASAMEYLTQFGDKFLKLNSPTSSALNIQVPDATALFIPEFILDRAFYANDTNGEQQWKLALESERIVYVYAYAVNNNIWQVQVLHGSKAITQARSSDLFTVTVAGREVLYETQETEDSFELTWTFSGLNYRLIVPKESVPSTQRMRLNFRSEALTAEALEPFYSDEVPETELEEEGTGTQIKSSVHVVPATSQGKVAGVSTQE